MADAGLSLVGFMDQQQALNHLRVACVSSDPSDAALIPEWQAAVAGIGPPIARAGLPDIQPIPTSHEPYIQQLTQLPWVQQHLAGLANATFQLVEIDPLLAFQFAISSPRSSHHCGHLSNPPTLDDLLAVCLPLQQTNEEINVVPTAQSILVKAKSLNIRTLQAGMLANNLLGLAFGLTLPLLHVVRHNGKCYLHNGFHRALGVRGAGATHVPCLFRDVPDHEAVGIRNDGATFGVPLLESNNPPTLGHFTQGRAHQVSLRSVSRILHVSWSEYAVPDE